MGTNEVQTAEIITSQGRANKTVDGIIQGMAIAAPITGQIGGTIEAKIATMMMMAIRQDATTAETIPRADVVDVVAVVGVEGVVITRFVSGFGTLTGGTIIKIQTISI